MRWSILLFVSCILFIEPAFAQARFPFTAATVSDRVNVRAGQNNNFESVAILAKGTAVVVVAKSFQWYKIALPAGSRAFIKSEYIKLISPEIGEVLPDHLNVRALANTQSTSLGQLSRGQKFSVQEDQGIWIRVKSADGLYGWVQESFLAFRSDGVSESKAF